MSEFSFSVLIATYEGDDPDDLERALQSVINQTVPPDEIVVVADGPLTQQQDTVLTKLAEEHPGLFHRTSLLTNRGLGAALSHGVETCSYEWIARMDSDDVAVDDRFERQIEYLRDNPEADAVGGYIGEFETDPTDVIHVREVPLSHNAIKDLGRFRCPMNHPSVMFRRQAVLNAGNYREYRSMQDYELWMRMVSMGCILANLPLVLVKCHAGADLYKRRGGIDYARIEFSIQRELLRHGLISVFVFIFNLCTRLPVRLLPACLRGFIYKTVLRD